MLTALLGTEWTAEAITLIITAIGGQLVVILKLFTDKNGTKLDELRQQMAIDRSSQTAFNEAILARLSKLEGKTHE